MKTKEGIETVDDVLTLMKEQNTDVYKTLGYAKTLMKQYVQAPKKPRLGQNHTAQEVAKYASDLAEYEIVKKNYDKESSERDQYNGIIYSAMDEYIREESGLNSVVPEQYRSKVYMKAYDDGHANGYYEVYVQLLSLVDIFDVKS